MKKINSALILLLFVNTVYAQNPLVKQWDYRFGGDTTEWFSHLLQNTNRGYVLGGWSYSNISGDKTQASWGEEDFWLIVTDSLGNKIWDKRYGGSSTDRLFSLQQTIDGGYILGGNSYSGISGDKTQANWAPAGLSADYWIVKIDSIGNKEWDKRFGGIGEDYFSSVIQTSDKGYIVGGYSESPISGDKTQAPWGGVSNDYWIVKIDSIGNKQWDKRYGGTSEDFMFDIYQTSDNGYLLSGASYSGMNGDKTQPSWGNVDYWIVKIDSVGNKQWDKRYGGIYADRFASMQKTEDGGFVLGGDSNSDISGDKTQAPWGLSYDYWIVKIDSLGNKQWDRTFGGTMNEEFYHIEKTIDNGFLLSGDSYSNLSGDKTENNLGQEQTWIVKSDSLGNKQWEKTILTSGHDEEGYAIQTNDGCYAIANMANGGIGGYKTQANWDTICNPICTYDYWIVKFCDTTSTTSIEQFSNYPFSFSIYPNPTKKILTIALNKSKKITVINLLGKIMIEKNISSVSNGKVDLGISFLPSGIYFIKVDNEVKKFVKE